MTDPIIPPDWNQNQHPSTPIPEGPNQSKPAKPYPGTPEQNSCPIPQKQPEGLDPLMCDVDHGLGNLAFLKEKNTREV